MLFEVEVGGQIRNNESLRKFLKGVDFLIYEETKTT